MEMEADRLVGDDAVKDVETVDNDPAQVLRRKQVGAQTKIRIASACEQAVIAYEQFNGHMTEVVCKGMQMDCRDHDVVAAPPPGGPQPHQGEGSKTRALCRAASRRPLSGLRGLREVALQSARVFAPSPWCGSGPPGGGPAKCSGFRPLCFAPPFRFLVGGIGWLGS
jgi:hypothetical protein